MSVEPSDLALADMAVRIVRRIVAETDAAQIVVDGFAHLPAFGAEPCAPTGWDVLSEIADVLDVLTEFTERLEENGERVHLVPFGWNKTCHADAFEGADAQRVIHLSACDTGGGRAVTSFAGAGDHSSRSRQPLWRTSCTRSS
ncbi:hypothetical protein AB0C34_09595 [Nocardia sp. NPDC049220]|uniref:hypothetical protein n=1 Tax=Nocardia sp. NPDC049220 TaxID=3155273 RepID=UPI0034047048